MSESGGRPSDILRERTKADLSELAEEHGADTVIDAVMAWLLVGRIKAKED